MGHTVHSGGELKGIPADSTSSKSRWIRGQSFGHPTGVAFTMSTKEQSDRRTYQRYLVKESVFLTFRPTFNKLGSLKDISKSGVSFEYIAYESMDTPINVEIDIFSKSMDIHLSKVPCKVVYDVKIGDSFTMNQVETRRCGLQFEGLSNQHSLQLKSILSSYIAGPTPYV